ncbi:C4-dicarboxylate transport transcriptional regulatory protein DctD [Grimontia celer]|uniref:C4-dicarboxylate transport transcriptional regulatory protein DctD n=1 Tax=Grimontia celer TaxID=1796497 RepID=A0A128F325_9GAMM|nr:sigma-54 dependent transcriptional regulator [Grimontia celer]CZF80814.1 C4-dicarboxylate transport transcriptional regulatory protein DctD [Grimontia celer]
MTPEIWIIDDERTIRDALSQTLDIEGFHSRAFANAKDALEQLSTAFEGVIISDINMPQMDGMTFLKKALDVDSELSIVMLTGHGDISTAVSAMRQGAYDFLEKPFSTDHLLDVLKRGIDKRQLVMENRELKRQLETQSAPGPRILGNADSVKQLRRSIFHLKDQDGDVLLQGERGTGKELAARFIHDQGTRQDEPFVGMKCRQIPEALIAMELFGSEQLAYATLPSYKNSKIAAAGKGTLFLDGIEALPLNVQEKLAALADSSERPRIIASTRVDLTNSIAQGHFSAALFKRLSATSLVFPPLRDRSEDVITLCQNFVRTTASRFGVAPPTLDAEHKDKLLQHPWKGNVRELQAYSERWVLMGEQCLKNEGGTDHEKEHDTLADRILKVERAILFDALNRHNGMLKEVQNELGLARKTLYEKLKKHHLDKQNFKG